MQSMTFEIIRWILGSVLILLGGYISSFALIRTIINYRNQKRGVDRFISGTPIVGPLLFISGWIISPLPWNYAVLFILILDFDTLLLPFGITYAFIHKNDEKQKEAK